MAPSVDPEFAAAIAPLRPMLSQIPAPAAHDVQTRRRNLEAFIRNSSPPAVPGGLTQDILSVTTADSTSISLWRVAKNPAAGPEGSTLGPAALYIHGGVFIALSAQVVMEKVYELVLASGVSIYVVDYRLAPEHPYPAPLDDCWASLQHVRDNAVALGVDVARIGIWGDSAGGNLAAAVTLLARDRGIAPLIARQFLLFPMLDDRNNEVLDPETVTLWNDADNVTGWGAYLGSRAGGDDVPVYAAPGRLTDATGLPPLVIYVGQLDLFVKEDVRYAMLFLEAGIDTELRVVPGLPHGFNGLAKDHRATKELFALSVRHLKGLAAE